MQNQFASADEAIQWIDGARWTGQKNGLENTRALLARLGNPEKRLRLLHVAGTNGKGSVCAMLERALRENGKHTGLFTSPYLCRFQERIRIDGQPIADAVLIDCASAVRTQAQALADAGIFTTTFEILTALTFVVFERAHVDIAVIEVGLGGRLDPTNVITPAVSAIATIAMDHTKTLGSTLPAIAGEKAGIIKPDIPVVVMNQSAEIIDVMARTARARHAQLYVTGEAQLLRADMHGSEFLLTLPHGARVRQKISLPGTYQVKNAALALSVLDVLGGLDRDACVRGIEKTRWPGRLEWIGSVLIDGAHNPEGASSLRAYANQYLAGRKIVLLTGMMQDKDIRSCVKALSGMAQHVITTRVDWPRAARAEDLSALYGACARPVADVAQALAAAQALAGPDGLLIVAGSLYLVGEVRNLLCPNDSGNL